MPRLQKPRPTPPQPRPRRPRSLPTTPTTRVAVTGGIGAGKSAALEAFRRHGAAVLSSDDVVHRLYAEDAEVRAGLERRFGTTDRTRIAEIVFADAGELAWLEALLHPRVRAVYTTWLDGVDAAVAVVEIPLLYETGADALFDAVVVVTAPAAVRRRRRGDQVDARSGRLEPDEEKAARADFAFENDGTPEELDAFVAGVMERLQSDT